MRDTRPAMTVVRAAEVSAQVEGHRAECVEVVRRAYLAHDAGDSAVPWSSFLRFPDRPRSRVIALPAWLGGEFDVAGIKWIASFPDNTRAGLPRASAALLLNDVETGFPYACVEASLVSATRTAASAVLAAEALLGGRLAKRIGVVGTGLISRHVLQFLAELGWKTGELRLFDLARPAAERFAAEAAGTGVAETVKVVDEIGDAFQDCDLVLFATVAAEPHVDDVELLRHRPVVLHLSLRDLSPAMILAAQNLTDDVDHALRERTSLHLVEQQSGHREFVHGTIADVLRGRLNRDGQRACVFSPFGLGVLDLAICQWVYRRVVDSGGGTRIPDFFPDSP